MLSRGLRPVPVALVGWLLSLSFGGCSTERDPNELLGPSAAGLVVVDAVLVVDAFLPSVRLSRTIDPDRYYSVTESALSDADVEIRVGGEIVGYREVTTQPGLYVPDSPLGEKVLPGTLYELRVGTPEGETVTARTLTPPAFPEVRWLLLEEDGATVRKELVTFEEAGDRVYEENLLIHGDGLLEARYPRPDVPGFQAALYSLEDSSEFVIDVSFLDEEDLEEFTRENTSPVFVIEDGRFRLPWFAVAFQGRYRIEIFAVDRNWYDLVRSFPELNGGGGFGFGGNTGDNFEKPFFHIEGGIGLFGSAARNEIGFCVNCEEQPE